MDGTGGEGKVIFNRRNALLTKIMLAMTVIFAVAMAIGDSDYEVWTLVGGVCVAIVLASAFVGASLAGRQQLSRIVLREDELIVQRVHFLDRGEILRLPLDEIENWSVRQQQYKSSAYTDIAFEHAGRRFSFYLSDDAKPDMAAIEALIPEYAWGNGGRDPEGARAGENP